MNATNENLTLTVHARTEREKNLAYRERMEFVPGIVYGHNIATPFRVKMAPNEIKKLYLTAGRTGLVTLKASEGAPKELEGQKVLIKEIQTHPYKNNLTHVDFHKIDLAKKIRVTVPLRFVGKAKGTGEGGILSIIARQVEIKSLPTQIPNHIDVDVTDVDVNDSIHIEDLAKKNTDTNIEYIYDSNFVLVAVVPPEEEEVAAPVAAAAEGAAAGAAPAAGAPAAGAPAAGGAAPAAGAAGAKAPAAPAKK